MAKYFNRQEAEVTRSEFVSQFPHVRVNDVHDITNQETGEYQYSFFSVGFGDNPFIAYINSDEEMESLIDFCNYVAHALADNRQSKEQETLA